MGRAQVHKEVLRINSWHGLESATREAALKEINALRLKLVRVYHEIGHEIACECGVCRILKEDGE